MELSNPNDINRILEQDKDQPDVDSILAQDKDQVDIDSILEQDRIVSETPLQEEAIPAPETEELPPVYIPFLSKDTDGIYTMGKLVTTGISNATKDFFSKGLELLLEETPWERFEKKFGGKQDFLTKATDPTKFLRGLATLATGNLRVKDALEDVEAAQQWRADQLKEIRGTEESFALDVAQAVGTSIGTTLPSLAVGAVGGTVPAIATLTASTFASDYTDRRERNPTGGELRNVMASTLNAVIEGGSEAIPFSKLLKLMKPGASTTRKVAEFLVAEELSEFSSEIGQNFVEQFIGAPGEKTWQEFQDDLAYSLAVTAVATPLGAGAQVGIVNTPKAISKGVDAVFGKLEDQGQEIDDGRQSALDVLEGEISNLEGLSQEKAEALNNILQEVVQLRQAKAAENKQREVEQGERQTESDRTFWTRLKKAVDDSYNKRDKWGAIKSNAIDSIVATQSNSGAIVPELTDSTGKKVLLDRKFLESVDSSGGGIYIQTPRYASEQVARYERQMQMLRDNGLKSRDPGVREKVASKLKELTRRKREAQEALEKETKQLQNLVPVLEGLKAEFGLKGAIVLGADRQNGSPISAYGEYTSMGRSHHIGLHPTALRRMGTGKNLEASKSMNTFLHEFGHAYFAEKTQGIPESTVDELYKLYLEESKRVLLEGSVDEVSSTLKVRPSRNMQDGEQIDRRRKTKWRKQASLNMEAAAYDAGFIEFAANMFSVMAGKNPKVLNSFEKDFARIGKTMRTMYRRLKKNHDDAVPNSFRLWMETLLTTEETLAIDKQLREKGKERDRLIKDLAENPPQIAARQRVGGLMEKAFPNYRDHKLKERVVKDVDTYNWGLRLFGSLLHLGQENPHIEELQSYIETSKQWWRTKTSWGQIAVDEFLTDWPKIVRGQKERDDFDLLLYVADQKSSGLKRALSDQEVREIARDEGLDSLEDRHFEFAERIWAFYRKAAQAVVDKELERADELEDEDARLARIRDLNETAKKVKNTNYFPHTRFGKYTVFVETLEPMVFEGQKFNAKKQKVLFQTFETQAEQKAFVKEFNKKYGKEGVKLTAGIIEDDLTLSMQGIPAELQEMILARVEAEKIVPKEEIDSMRLLLRQMDLNMSPGENFRKRFLKRKGRLGYDKDSRRVFSDYFMRFSNHMARISHNKELEQAIKELRETYTKGDAGEIIDYAPDETGMRMVSTVKRQQIAEHLARHFQYLNNPGNELASWRALGFIFYLGFNPKSAMVNLTQVPMVTYPWLAARFRDDQAIVAIRGAMKRVNKNYTEADSTSPWEDQGMLELRKRGILGESLATELAGGADSSYLSRTSLGKVLGSETIGSATRMFADKAAWMFHVAEEYNREITARAAYDLATKSGMAHGAAINFAQRAIESTQFEYARWNRAEAMRGKLSVFTMFWQYLTNQTYFILRERGQGRYLLLMFLIAGAEGIPFFGGNGMNLYNMLATKMKGLLGMKDPKTTVQNDLRALINSIHDKPVMGVMPSDLFMKGASRYLGPFDLHGSMSLGSPIPGIDNFARETPKGSPLEGALQDAGGALVNIPFNWVNAIYSNDPDTWKKAERMAPVFTANISKAIRISSRGKETAANGAEVFEFNPESFGDWVKMAGVGAGFPLREINARREGMYVANDSINYYKGRRQALLNEHFFQQDLEGGDTAKVREKMKKFNASVPYPAMKINFVKDLTPSLKSRSKRRAVLESGTVLEKRYRGLYNEILELYPDN